MVLRTCDKKNRKRGLRERGAETGNKRDEQYQSIIICFTNEYFISVQRQENVGLTKMLLESSQNQYLLHIYV